MGLLNQLVASAAFNQGCLSSVLHVELFANKVKDSVVFGTTFVGLVGRSLKDLRHHVLALVGTHIGLHLARLKLAVFLHNFL